MGKLRSVNTDVQQRTMAGSFSCIACGKEVRPKQEALECPACLCWQHRTCGINITRTEYRQAIKGELEIDWRCDSCTEEDNASAYTPSTTITASSPRSSVTAPQLSPVIDPPSPLGSSLKCSFSLNFGDISFSEPQTPDVTNLSECFAVPFNEPTILDESNLERTISPPEEQTAQLEQKRFDVVIQGSKRGKDILVEVGGRLQLCKRWTR